MSERPVLRAARADLEAGRLWKARDRLGGAFQSDPTDQAVLDLLGEVHFRMGDLPQAGRFWLLTPRDDEAARAAGAALRERHGSIEALTAQVPLRARFEDYPDPVRRRLLDLKHRAREEEVAWPPRRRGLDEGWDDDDPEEDWKGMLVVSLFFMAMLGPWLFGVVAAVVLLVRAVT